MSGDISQPKFTDSTIKLLDNMRGEQSLASRLRKQGFPPSSYFSVCKRMLSQESNDAGKHITLISEIGNLTDIEITDEMISQLFDELTDRLRTLMKRLDGLGS